MIKIICVGKLTQQYLKTGIEHYNKQIAHKINWIEVNDENQSNGMQVEKQRIFERLNPDDFVVSLAIEGKQYSSEKFAREFDKWLTYQPHDVVFIIGGSNGLDEAVKKRSQVLLSFSPLTFPHQLMRLILIEQIYRATMIHKNHPYHK